jgi:hypothetical protein
MIGGGFAWEVDAERFPRFFEKLGHAEREGVGDDRAFGVAISNQIAEVGSFVVESAGGEGLVQFCNAAVDVLNGGAGGVPPVGVDKNISSRTREKGIAAAEQVDAGVKLGHAALMFSLKDGEVVDAHRTQATHGLYALQRT